MIADWEYLRRRFTRKTDLFITAPRLERMTVRLYEDGGQQLQLSTVGGDDVPELLWFFPRGKYVLLFHLNQKPEDEDYSKEAFLIGLDYRGAYLKRLDWFFLPWSITAVGVCASASVGISPSLTVKYRFQRQLRSILTLFGFEA